MDKYEGTNKPNITLSLNGSIERKRALPAACFEEAESSIESAETVEKGAEFEKEELERVEKEGSRITGFLLRGVAAALLLGFLFLPRFFPYTGSEKVTETAKNIIMSDTVPSGTIGEGKLVDIFRELLPETESDEGGDEKTE